MNLNEGFFVVHRHDTGFGRSEPFAHLRRQLTFEHHLRRDQLLVASRNIGDDRHSFARLPGLIDAFKQTGFHSRSPAYPAAEPVTGST